MYQETYRALIFVIRIVLSLYFIYFPSCHFLRSPHAIHACNLQNSNFNSVRFHLNLIHNEFLILFSLRQIFEFIKLYDITSSVLPHFAKLKRIVKLQKPVAK